MLISRRSFMQSILALSAAPAIVQAKYLMPMRRRTKFLYSVPLQTSNVSITETVERMVSPSASNIITSRYFYDADIQLLVPDGSRVTRVLANGEELTGVMELTSSDGRDVLRIKNLCLNPYGMRVPYITADFESE